MEEIFLEEAVLVKDEPEDCEMDYPFAQLEVVATPLVEIPKVDKFCRLCLRKLSNLLPLTSRLRDEMVPEMVYTVIGLNINFRDGLPKKVCINCLTKLDFAFNIRKEFTESQRTLKCFAASKVDSLEFCLHNFQKGSRAMTASKSDQILNQNRDVFQLLTQNLGQKIDENSLGTKTLSEKDSKTQDTGKDELVLNLDDLEGETVQYLIEMENTDTKVINDTQQTVEESEPEPEPNTKRRKSNIDLKTTVLDPNKCYICQTSFESTDDLKVHLPSHVDMIPYTCEQCLTIGGKPTKITSLILLHRHFRMHAGSIKCPKCPFRTCTRNGLYAHVKMRHNEDAMTEYTCEVCGLKMLNGKYFQRHMRVHQAVDEGKFTCSYCDKKFGTKTRLTRHMRSHTNEKPYACKYCGKSFTNETAMHGHERIHTGEKGFSCEICGCSFRVRGFLYDHMASAHGEMDQGSKQSLTLFPSTVKCEFKGCDFSTENRANYYAHKAKHELKHQCPKCPERFATKQKLEQHDFVHTKQKQHCCEVCGKSFRYKNSLDEHLAGHHNNRPHSCETCGMAFVRERTLKEHRLKHSDKMNYDCRYCDKKFKYCADRSKHERTHTEQVGPTQRVVLEIEPQDDTDMIVEVEMDP